MKLHALFVPLAAAVCIVGCNSGDTPVETYKTPPGQVTNPSAPPAQATPPKDSSDAISSNSNLSPAARNALMHTQGK